MREVTLEEAWATLRSAGFNHQYEDGWLSIFPGKVLVGRALTSQWLPGRPDIQAVLEQQGIADKRKGARKSVVQGKSGSVRVDLGGGRILKKKTHHKRQT